MHGLNTLILPPDDEEFCSKCRQWKKCHKFHKDKTRKSGLDSYCASCRNALQMERDRRKSATENLTLI